MTFFEAVGKCYRKYFVFKGRASKSEYWWFYLLFLLFAWPIFLAETNDHYWARLLNFVYFFLTVSAIFPLAAVFTRRLHDVGRSGWSIFYFLIPVVGFILLLRWTTKDGNPGPNKYGEPDNLPFVMSKKTTARQ